jgi:uncharacterized membrane protein
MSFMAFLLAIAIGIIAGLRSMTAPAAVSWAAHLKWIDLHNSKLAFMGSSAATYILSALAVAELVADKLPKTGKRTAAGPLIARIVTGALSGAALCAAANSSSLVGAVLGAVGALAGTFGGYQIRHRLVEGLKVPDFIIAIIEDIVAVGAAFLIVSRI